MASLHRAVRVAQSSHLKSPSSCFSSFPVILFSALQHSSFNVPTRIIHRRFPGGRPTQPILLVLHEGAHGHVTSCALVETEVTAVEHFSRQGYVPGCAMRPENFCMHRSIEAQHGGSMSGPSLMGKVQNAQNLYSMDLLIVMYIIFHTVYQSWYEFWIGDISTSVYF